MSDTPGRSLFLLDTGHSVHSERPKFLASEIARFVLQEAPSPPRSDRTWVIADGAPLFRFTGSVHEWSAAISISANDLGKKIIELRLVITTGHDDLRGGSSAGDNCDVVLILRSGASFTTANINGGSNWKNGEKHTVSLPIPAGARAGDITALALQTHFGGGIAGDNWNVNEVILIASLEPDPGVGCASSFVSQSVPSLMVAGQPYSVSVVFRNTGGETWSTANNFRLGAQNPQDNTIWLASSRVPLPGDIAPGASVTFQFTVVAPSILGNYNFQWRMVQEWVQWFGDLTDNLAVTVERPECASIRTDIQANRDQIATLTSERDLLHPGSIADRQQILAINREIASLTTKITQLQQRAATFNCRL